MNVLCEGGSSKHGFVLKRGSEKRLRPLPSGVSQNVFVRETVCEKKKKRKQVKSHHKKTMRREITKTNVIHPHTERHTDVYLRTASNCTCVCG